LAVAPPLLLSDAIKVPDDPVISKTNDDPP
jgi:hypothetical protein